MKVRDIPEDFQFVSTDHEVEEVKRLLNVKEDFDAFFVKIENGEIVKAYGMCGKIPHLGKEVVEVKA